MLFVLALFFNFLIGGVTGVFLSDVPVNVTVHGGFFVLSHFHYTIMGGLLFAFMAGLYYWLPKMTGKMMNKKIGKWHFWLMFVFFNLTFFPMFIIGLLGQPRRVFTYAKNLQGLNDFSSISAFILGFSFLVFFYNLVYSMWIKPEVAPANPWESLGLEWQTATPIPAYNFERIPVIMTDPYRYSEEGAPAFADFGTEGRARFVNPHNGLGRRRHDNEQFCKFNPATRVIPPKSASMRCVRTSVPSGPGGASSSAIYTFMLASLVFSYFYLRSSNNGLLWRPDHVTAPRAYGLLIFGFSLVTGILAYVGRKRLVDGFIHGLQRRGMVRGGYRTDRATAADSGVEPLGFLPWIKWLRVDLHWIRGNEHHFTGDQRVLAWRQR